MNGARPPMTADVAGVASPDVVYDDHHTNLRLMFYTAVSSSGRAFSPLPGITRIRALDSDSADM